MALEVRPAVASDLSDIRRVHRTSIGRACTPYTVEQVAAWLGELTPERYPEMLAMWLVIVASDSGRLMGFGAVDLSSATLNAVYVHPACLRQGIGSRLTSSLEALALDAGLDRLDTHSTLNAVGFYLTHGYVIDGETLNRFPSGLTLPGVAMHKVLAGECVEQAHQADAHEVEST